MDAISFKVSISKGFAQRMLTTVALIFSPTTKAGVSKVPNAKIAIFLLLSDVVEVNRRISAFANGKGSKVDSTATPAPTPRG